MVLRSGALPLLTAVVVMWAAPLAGQRELTVDMIFDSPELSVAGVGATWSPDGSTLALVTGEGLVVEDIVAGTRTVVVGADELVPPRGTVPVPIEGHSWSPDGRKLLIYTSSQRVWRQNTKGVYYIFDLDDRTLTPLSPEPGWQQFAKWSPTGDRIGFVRDNDIFVVDVADGSERPLTTGGSDVVINGTFDWVYEEELGLRDGWRWSPDGERIAYWQLDQSGVGVFTWVDDLAGSYSQPVPLRYPKAGEAPALARIGVIDADGGATTWMRTGGEPDDYLARMEWIGPDELVAQRLNRLQNRIDVVIADAVTGDARVVLSDTDPAWVDVDDDLTWLADSDRFLWTSERDGHNQIYLHDRDGEGVRRLTSDPVDVLHVDGVDESGGWVYYTAASPSAKERQLFRVPLAGGEAERLSDEAGSHSASLSPDGRYIIDRYSSAGVPTTTVVMRSDGELVRVLEDNAELRTRLAEFQLSAPEFFELPVAGEAGVTLNGYMIRPSDFDPGREYPVLLYVYGTPGAQTVTDSWGGTRYLWHQLLAQRGYIVASVDTRGTGGRGREFEKAGYLRQGQVVTDDLLGAARWLAEQSYVDADRIGVWGWSGGGYTTGFALARGGDVFAAGISVAPVTDWRLYDNIYTERFMRTPRENAEGYASTSVIDLAGGITADYLLIHGTADDNVHFQNAVQLAAALQAAGKQFDFMLYPNQNHGIPDRQAHVFTLMTDWLLEHL